MVSRIATSLPKLWTLPGAPWGSLLDTPMKASLRRLTTGKDYRRLVDHKGDPKALNHFVGKWELHTRKGEDKVLDALGIKGDTRKLFVSNKTIMIYSKHGDKWTYDVGLVSVPLLMSFNFKLNQPYECKNIDGTLLKSINHQSGKKLIEKHEALGANKYVVDVVKEVNGNTMTSIWTVKGNSMESIFKKK